MQTSSFSSTGDTVCFSSATLPTRCGSSVAIIVFALRHHAVAYALDYPLMHNSVGKSGFRDDLPRRGVVDLVLVAQVGDADELALVDR